MQIYLIINLKDGKLYIGQTVRSIKERFNEHCQKRYSKHSKLTRAILKHGRENFIYLKIDEAKDVDELNYKEEKWIAEINPQYNLSSGGLNKILSKESKEKQSKSLKAYYANPENVHCMKGKKLKKRHKDKIAETSLFVKGHKINNGRKQSIEQKEKRAEKLRGKKRTIEQRQVMSDGNKKSCARSNSKSGLKGVNYHKINKGWVARITVNRKRINLGLFNSSLEATKAYNNAVDKYFQGNAYKNPI